ncbi:cellulase family glycosylhydrolase [uncultured Thiodictyon sp.]|uniref:glycoside hydrolase family 5 protein n=1 Tax=uncultured Thiodictyon sp. TaxID=1846217 RepID=UPI0025DED31A|nr:cellulase family glycosylhydrolase [uncultured Thiodictyon sp.]
MTHLGNLLSGLALTVAIGLGLSSLPVVAGKNSAKTSAAAKAAAAAPAVLKRGVNLSHWQQYWGRQPVVAADMATIKKAGFDHVRLPFDPQKMGWNPDSPTPTIYWAALDQAVSIAQQAGLAIILDFHPEMALSQRIETEAAVHAAYVDFWQQMATHFAASPVSVVVFELFNEPSYWDPTGPARLAALEKQALDRIRQATPSRLVLIAPSRGGFLAGLLLITPVKDANVRYVFHYYDPKLFTYLHAPWEPFLSGPHGMIANLVYPAANALSQVQLLPNADPAIAMAAVNQYVAENWGATRIAQDIAQAQAWATQNGARLMCTEFGTLRVGPDVVSRQNWLKDTRSVLEGMGIGWSIWDYADMFGIAVSTNGMVTPASDPAIVPRDPLNPQRVFDRNLLRALGL